VAQAERAPLADATYQEVKQRTSVCLSGAGAKLLEWITDRGKQGISVSVVEVRLIAKYLAGEMAQSSTFKASYG